MIRQYAIAIILSLLSMGSAVASVCNTVGFQHGDAFDGPTVCEQGKQGHAVINGPLKISGTEFTGQVKINGPLSASKANFKALVKVNGPITVSDSQFAKRVIVRGPVDADNSKFDDVSMTSTKGTFSQSTVDHLQVKGKTPDEQQQVTVSNHSKIYAISFEQAGGIVYVDKTSSVSKVKNATIKSLP